MSHHAPHHHRANRFVAGLGLALLSLSACTQTPHQVAHRGLSSDGYGFVQNGPTLAPPEHLLQHQANATMAPASTSSPATANPSPAQPATTTQR